MNSMQGWLHGHTVCMEPYVQKDPVLALMFCYHCLEILNNVLTNINVRGLTFSFSMDLTDYVVGPDSMPHKQYIDTNKSPNNQIIRFI